MRETATGRAATTSRSLSSSSSPRRSSRSGPIHRLVKGISPGPSRGPARALLPDRACSRGPCRAPAPAAPGVIGLVHTRRLQAPLPACGSRAGSRGRSRREPAQGGAGQPPRARAQLRARMARSDHSSSRGPGGRGVPAAGRYRSRESSASRTTGAVWRPRAPISSPSPAPAWPSGRSKAERPEPQS